MKKKRILSIGLCALMIACAQPVWAEEAQSSETEMEEVQISEAEAEEPQIPDAEAEETETPAVQAEEASAVAQSLVVSPSADITVGETVTLEGTAATEGEPEAVYRYIYYDGITWREISSSYTPAPVEWTPGAAGDYLVSFQVQYDGQETNAFQNVHVNEKEPAYMRLNGVDTEVLASGGVQITPRYETNLSEEDVSFTYLLYDLSQQIWYTIQADTGDSCVWTPSKGGDYWIHVITKDASGKELTSTIGYHVAGAAVTGISMDRDGRQHWATTVTLTGSVSNPLGQHLVYEYLVYDGKVWKILDRSEVLKSISYQAEAPGDYLLCFQAYDESGAVIGQSFMGYIAEPSTITLGAIQTKAVKEKEVHVSVSAETTGTGLEYRWMYYDLEKQVWGIIQNWSDKAEAVWLPEKFGTYWIHVEARTEDGAASQATIGYQLQPFHTELTNLQVYTPDYATYYIMQNVESNDPNLKYLYQIYDLQTKTWSVLGTGHNTYWQPKSSGNYWIHAVITGSDGQKYENTIGYGIQGYKINRFGFSGNLKAGEAAVLSVSGSKFLNENYTFTYVQWNGSGWDSVYTGSTPKDFVWTPAAEGYYAFACNVTNEKGYLVDQATLQITPSNFYKNGWYYENGYKFYYIDNVKQLDLDGILPKQSSYLAKVNRTTCTVTIYAKDGSNGYIIPVKRFACSVGRPGEETPAGTFHTLAKYRWHELIGPSYGQYCTRIVGGILFHSVAGSNMTSYNLNPVEYNKLGSPASAGCVRLCVRDAKWIYDNCPLGMQVEIYDSPDPGPLGQGPIIRITDPNQNWDPTDPNI